MTMRRLFAVLGQNVSESLSPILHQAAALRLGLDLAYVPVCCRNEDHFREAVAALSCLGAGGCNVTIPYKAAAFQLASSHSEVARELGVVNTLSFSKEGHIHGDNTDAQALTLLFQQLPRSALDKVQILGAGGVCRAALWALKPIAGEIFISARRGAAELTKDGRAVACTLAPIPGVTLVVSGLPKDSSLAQQVFSEWVDVRATPIIYDLAYGSTARLSPLAEQGKQRGLVHFDGRALLREQAALALQLWTQADLTTIRHAMAEVLPDEVLPLT